MGEFIWPDWKPVPQDTPPPSAPPPDPVAAREEKIADDARVEQSLNRFIAGKQAALFEAPDAFYRAQGEDAIHAVPVAAQKLDDLRQDLLDKLGNDTQRRRLREALDAQMHLTREGMARHVAEQSLAWQRGIAQDRIALLAKEAAHHHNDDGLVDALGHAAATAARAHSRVGDGPPGGDAEDAAAATARSSVLGAAIQARLDRGDTEGANALFTQMQDQFDPAHAAPLQGQIDAGPVMVLPYRPPLDDSGIKVEPLPYRPPMDGTLDGASILRELADVPEGESTPDQNNGKTVLVNATPDDAMGAAKADPQLAQAPSAGRQAASSPPPSAKLPISENERDTAQSSIDQHAYQARAQLDRFASTPRTPDDDKYKGPLPADWEKKLPPETLKKLNESAAEYGVPRELIAAILWEESTFKEKAGAGSTAEGQGMAGMSLGAQKDLITKAQREKKPERESELKTFDRMKGPAAVSMAAEYFKQLYDDNGQHWPSAVMAYRLGRTAVNNWLNGMGNDIEKNYPARWEQGKTYLWRIFQGRSHLFDTEDAPEFP